MSNLFNPIQAATDYKAGLISKRGVFIRQLVFIAYLLIYVFFLLIPSPNPIYDIISTIGFLFLYLGVPFFFNKGIDGKDFVSRFAVVHTPIFIDVMIGLIIAGIIQGILMIVGAVPVTAEPSYGIVPITFDIFADIFSVIFMILAFKKYK